MAIYPIQQTFGRGIFSPRLHARYDVEHWRAGMADALNMVVMRQGGARRREGSQFVGLSKLQGASDKTRLIPFIYSSTQAYVIELSNLVARFWALSGQVLSGGTPYEVVTPWLADDLDELQFAQSGDVIYVTHTRYEPQKLSRFGETNWTCAGVELLDGPYQEINTTATVLTPSATGDLVPSMTSATLPSGTASASTEHSATYAAWKAFDKDRATAWMSSNTAGEHTLTYQFGTAKVVAGYSIQSPSGTATGALAPAYPPGNWAPRRWAMEGSNDGSTWVLLDTRTGETGWSDSERRFYTFKNETAYSYFRLRISDRNDSNATWWVAIGEWSLQGSGADAQTITITASSTTGINGGTGFVTTDVGRQIRLFSEAAYWHWGEISALNSTTSVDVVLKSPPLPGLSGSSTWRLGAFSLTTGFPGAVSFYGDRLSYARTVSQPRTLWTSKAADLDNFGTSIPTQADDAFTLTLTDGGAINWLSEDDDILCGTDTALRAIGKADTNQAFSATNFKIGRKIFAGSERAQAVVADGATLFIERFGKSIREVTYSFEMNGYSADDISILSEHLFDSKLVRLAHCSTPDGLIWGQLEDGTFISVTYERKQQMVALTRHALGGDGVIESIATIPGTDGWELWMVVRRGATFRTIEKIGPSSDTKARADDCHLDCRQSYTSAAATTVSSINSVFNGQTMAVYADGMQDGDVTISGGAFSLASGNDAGTIHFGYDFESFIELLPVAVQGQSGSMLGQKKAIGRAVLSIMGTGGVKIKGSEQEAEEVNLSDVNDSIDAPHELVTGTVMGFANSSWFSKGEGLRIVSKRAEPMIIRAVIPVVEGE